VVQLFPRNAWHNIYFNTPKPPVNDKRVRQAFAYAIDQRGTIARAVEGWGALGAYIGPHLRPLALSEEELLKHPYFSTDMVARRAKARELLKEAGFPDGIKLDLWQRKGPQYDRGAIANVADLKLAGIDVTLRLLDTAANTDLLNSGNFLINTTPSATSVDDPTGYLDDFVCNMGVSINRSRYCNPDYDKLFYAQNQEFDPAKRAQILHQMELLLLDDMPEHRSYYWMQVMGVWNRVQGWQLSVGDQVYNFRRFETVWCKEGKCQ
ncbi:MAG: hypothetical protein HY686_06780, partial [Chloroflexi bacterium]|nr:hypothetical protein [Chloroflexota bacterium]